MSICFSKARSWSAILLAAILLSVCLVSITHAQISQLIVFGNSHVDLGNARDMLEDNFYLFEDGLAAIGKSEIPPWRYTFSSGNSMIEYLSAELGLPVDPVENYVFPNSIPYGEAPMGTNYAIAGAIVPADKQVERYLNDVNYDADSDAAYIMVFGTNHIINGFFDKTTAEGRFYVDTRLDELETGIRMLISSGANNIYVFNVDAVGSAPMFDLVGNDAIVNELVDYYNSELMDRLDLINSELGNHAKMFNLYGAVFAMRNTGRFGYSNTDSPCNFGDHYMNLTNAEFDDVLNVIEVMDGEESMQALNISNVRSYYTGGTYTTAANPYYSSGPNPSCSPSQNSTYMYYDLIHFSEKAHEDIAEILIDQVASEGQCRERTSTLNEHVDKVRAYSYTSSTWWSTVTTWYSMLGEDNLGSNGNSIVTLVDQDGSGHWEIGECSGPSSPTLINKEATVIGQNVTITGTASDQDNDIVEVLLTADGFGQMVCEGTTSFTCDAGIFSAGNYTLTLNVVDATGLESGETPITFVVEPPTAPEVNIDSVTHQNKTLTVTGSATDINNDITTITLSVEGMPDVACSVSENFSCSMTFDVPDGNYHGQITIKDSENLQSYEQFDFDVESYECVTSDNISHINAGRATSSGGFFPTAYALGSGNNLGYASVYYNQSSSVQKTGDNYWIKVSSCP